jgi:Ca-activated chloride channel family protein
MQHASLPRNVLFALIFCLFLSSLAWADGLVIVHDAPGRPDHFAFTPLEVSYHHVDVSIDDRVASTSVDQEFINPTNQRLEGTYIFPLPEGATIDKFSMDIDGKMTDAELLDANKARSIYEETVRKYRDPALLEYVGRGAMKVRIFPIEPNSKKQIKIRYTQVIKADASILEYMYPLNTEKFSSKPLRDVSVRVKLACNTPIKSVYCPSHEVDVKRDGDRRATIGFEARNARPDTDFKLIVTRQPDPVGINVLAYRDSASGEGYFMMLASPGALESSDDVQPKDICFVVDTSGSMAGPKLEQAKKALNFCLANLNGGDRFEIIRFSTETENVFGGLQEASQANVEKARGFVDKLKPIGGTAIDDALKKAIQLQRNDPHLGDIAARPYVIIFMTDGQPTVGATNEDQIVSHVGKPDLQVRVFPFGIGTDVNTTLLDRISNETRAFSQYVLPEEDIEIKVSTFYTKIQSPVLSNLKLTCDDPDVRISQIYPGSLPDLFKGETLIAFGRFSGDGQAELQVSGTRSGQPVNIRSVIDFHPRDTRYGFIPRLWATRRVGWLLDEIRMHGESKELVDEVTQLAREHGIVTPYTAYLIMEDERRRNVPMGARTMRELESDAKARGAVADTLASVSAGSPRQEKAGGRAVENALNIDGLKRSSNEQQAQQGMALGKPGFAGANNDGGYKLAQNYSQQVKVVNGRAFFQNGQTWSDATSQTRQNLKRQEVKFNSDEYFALLAKNPSAAPWLSLGNEVDLVLDDTLYVVR